MKKLLCILLMIACIQGSFAQDKKNDEKKKKKTANPFYGVVGLNLSKITGESGSYTSLLPGLAIGGGIRLIEFNQSFGLCTEILYSMQGSKYDDPPYTSGKVVTSYINIPIIVRWRDKSGFYGETGVQPGFLLSAKDKYDGGSYDYKDYVSSFDFGVPVGVGYEFKNHIGIGARVTFGLSNVNKGGTDPAKDHNFVGQFRVSYGF